MVHSQGFRCLVAGLGVTCAAGAHELDVGRNVLLLLEGVRHQCAPLRRGNTSNMLPEVKYLRCCLFAGGSGFGCCISCFVFRLTGLGFQDSGFGFRVSGFELMVDG
jgi:hypothetical protein